MSRTCTLAPTLGLAAIAVLASLAVPQAARAQTSYTVIDLTPTNNDGAGAGAISGNTQVGSVSLSNNISHAVLWHGTATSIVDLNPTGFSNSSANGVDGSMQVGSGYADGGSFSTEHALLWQGTAASVVDLNPAGFSSSAASGVFDDIQVGYGLPTGTGDTHALLWTGTAASVVDLQPAGFNDSFANGVDSNTQVGNGDVPDPSGDGQDDHALLWHGTADSVVDLNPAGFNGSSANGVDGNTQVGMGIISDGDFGASYALLWHGTAASVVNLTPNNDPNGNAYAEAFAVSGNVQVGASGDHAMAWHGTASSMVDLNAFLPAGYNIQSVAFGVNATGDIVGYGYGTSGQHAFLWHPVTAPATLTITSLDPASRTAGREAFTLTVTGTGFTPASKVQWNGMAQTTTFVSATTLTASIPASLIATAGTASVTVNTPGVGTSNSRTETINPRPVISSLSPTSKKAGSSAFTLTVNGTGFLSNSIVKWNDDELATTYVSATKLTAFVSASRLHTAGTETITVTTPQVATSAGKSFTITP